MNKLYTIGYGGGRKRTRWPDFLQRLLDADIDCVVDLREERSKSRNGKAFWWGHNLYGKPYMGNLLSAKMEYFTIPALANFTTLRLYRAWLHLNPYRLEKLRNIIKEFPDSNICLLCCERDYRRCHRKIVAEFIVEEMGLEEVVHL